MSSEYTKIYTGNLFMVQQIVSQLQETGIEPVVKDASESARLAGFAANIDGAREIHVNNDEVDGAKAIVDRIVSEK